MTQCNFVEKLFSRRFVVLCALIVLCTFGGVGPAAGQFNAIITENAKAGNAASQWDISGAGDSSIQGFANQISVNRGETVSFKVKTNASAYRLDIYRLGYYAGLGARLVATVFPSVALPQSQPNPLTNSTTGLVDCGNWAVSASWTVPSDATSGIYIVKLVRSDTGGASHMVFIVRDDQGASDILFQTSDTTWQAYNSYGGNSLYVGSPAGRAYKVSYNRPFNTRAGQTSYDWLFNAEYPMLRWLEANGYNVSYSTGVDSESRGALIRNHRVFMSVGHDEYWSGNQRTNVESARAAGVSLAFLSGNEIFWKTRFEAAIDGSGTPNRTLVCYKETIAGAKIDPSPLWTGTWRDPRFSPPADGGRPENALSGTIFAVNSSAATDRIQVPYIYSRHWLWRNSGVDTISSGSTASLGVGTLGYEWDICPDNGFQPGGLLRLSATTISGLELLQDYGSSYATGTATHNLSWYRDTSGAFVFGAGTAQWSWGLDSQHDNTSAAVNPAMRQATVNFLAKMAVQPGTLQSGLVVGAASSDNSAPVSSIRSPVNGAALAVDQQTTISGVATDSGGQVWSVEVSTDGGVVWQAATGTGNWSYSWVPRGSDTVNLRSRALDDSGNLETPAPGITVSVGGTSGSSGSVWTAGVVPGVVDGGPDSAVELGIKFRSDVAGSVTGVRFYKASTNTGIHVGNLWTSTGTRLATATFANETSSGWQEVRFASPVAIAANTIYVASYNCPGGHYSADDNYFLSTGVDVAPLHLPSSPASGGNGVYAYGSTSNFPTQVYRATNYWVDVVFQAGTAPALRSIAVTPASPTAVTGTSLQLTATATYSDGSVQDITAQATWSSSNTAVATVDTAGRVSAIGSGSATISAAQSGISGGTTLSVTNAALAISTSTLPGGALNSAYSATVAATGGASPYTWSISAGALPAGLALNATNGVIAGTPSASGTSNFTVRVLDTGNPAQTATRALSISIASVSTPTSIWPASAIPKVPESGPDSSVELGLKFRSDVPGTITGVRFYKAARNTGTHTGSLWSSTGTLLASGTFINETASGWQQLNFATPVAIAANTVYVVSYHATGGRYSADQNFFNNSGVDNPPLHALANGVAGGNGVYTYATGAAFPNQTFRTTNYWVDIVFRAQ